MKRFFAALRFLTVCPLPQGWGEGVGDLARSTPFFPFVGVGIGVVVGAATWGMGRVFPDAVTGVGAAIALMAASGGFHMDGLSDAADGLLSARPRDRMLEIMRDSHIGAMGVMAIVAVFCLKAAALSGLSDALRWRAVVLMPVAGRCALVVSMGLLPYARPEGGLGAIFFAHPPRLSAFWAVVVLLGVGWFANGVHGLIACGGCLGLVAVFSGYVYRKVGGATGDTLGAVCELTECLVPLMFFL